MPEVTRGMHLFLLQEQISYFDEGSPAEVMALVIGIAVVILIAVVAHLIRTGGKKTIVGNSGHYTAPKRFSGFSLRRAAAPYGLTGEQIKLLQYVFRNDNVTDPARVMKDHTALDRHFKRAFKNIMKDSRDAEKAQQNITKLFVLRNTIEAAPIEENVASSLPVENTQVILKSGKDSYNVKVLLSKGKEIMTELPINSLGTPIKVTKGTNLTLTYLSRSGNAYSLSGSIMGTQKTQHGSGLQLTAGGRPKPLTKRQYRRKQIDLRCDFYMVQLIESGRGRKKVSKLVVSPKRFAGKLGDISAGGCSIRTGVPVQAAARLKISCNLEDDNQISVLGQVIRSNRSSTGTVIHVKFLKVPTRAFNSINALVFGFNES